MRASVKLTSLRVSNLLSFDEFELTLGDGLTVIVGPNGSGKTNVVRVLDLVSKLVDWSDERSRSAAVAPSPAGSVLTSYVQAMHNDPPQGTPIEVRVRVEWTTDSERERIVGFVRAAVLATLAEESQAHDEPRKATLSAWVLREIDETKLAPLLQGTLAFHHPGYENAVWEAWYEFEHRGRFYDWTLYRPNSWESIVPHGTDEGAHTPISSMKLWEALFGEAPSTSPPTALPDPLPHFEFSSLCPPAGQKLASLVVRVGTGAFSGQHEPFRKVASLLDFPASDTMGQQAYGLARAMSICVREGEVVLGEQFRGLGIGGTIPWRAGIYPWELLAGSTPPRDPGFLPLRLFELKNGASAKERETFVAIQQLFERLAPGRSFDVTFRAANMPVPAPAPIGAGQVVVPGGDGEAGGEAPPGCIVTAVVWKTSADDGHRRERPIQLYGAGTWEALVMAEALVKSEGRLTVLDEPGISLHPTWQTVLRSVLRDAPGQVLLVTHSPSLVPMETGEDLQRLDRMSIEVGASRLHQLPANLTTAAFAKMTRAFALSADARALLFCRGAVLVSGETELGALPIWSSKGATAQDLGTPSELDLAFYSVSGDGGFANVLSVLHAFDIPWVLVCDGKSFDIATNWGSHVFRQIEKSGVKIPDLTSFTGRVSKSGKSKRTMTNGLWDEQLALGAQHGVLTLAAGWTRADESMEAFFERVVPGKLAQAELEVGDSKIRKGRWTALNTPCPSEVDHLYRQVVAALQR